MSKNRFFSILSNIHFNDNDTSIKNLKLAKIEPLITSLNNSFNKYNYPAKEICIDESIVPFRGRLSFKKYIP